MQVTETNLEGQPQATVPNRDWTWGCNPLGYPVPTEPDPEILLGSYPELACLELDPRSLAYPPFAPGNAYLDSAVNNVPPAF